MEKFQILLNFFQRIINQTLTQNFFFFHSGLNSVRHLCFYKALTTSNPLPNSQTWLCMALRTFMKSSFLNHIISGYHSHREISDLLLTEISENWELDGELEIQIFQTLEFHLDVDLWGSQKWAGLLRKQWPWAGKPGFGHSSAKHLLCNVGQILLLAGSRFSH